jgi:DNA polymerase-3 subunit beta
MGKTPNDSRPGEISGSVDARAFTARLKLLAKHAEKSNTTPILNYVVLAFDGLGARMKVAWYGIDLSLEATLAAEGMGAVALPLKTLLAFVSNADGETISFEKARDAAAVTIKCGRYNAALYPLDPADAPKLQTPTVFARGFPMPEGVLAHLLALTAPFVSTEETRYYLNGVCFELDTDTLRAIATDGHKLGTRETKLAPGSLEAWAMRPIVPNEAIDAIAGIIGTAQCIARFHGDYREATNNPLAGYAQRSAGWYNQLASFSSDDWTITTKLIDGNFPDWRRVVPKGSPDTVTAAIHAGDVRRFASMLKGMSDGHALQISPRDGEAVELSSGTKFSEGRMTGEARAEVGGKFEPFGFNAKYLATMAKAFGSDWLEMRIDSPSSPFLMRAKNSPEGELAVLMPMRI